MVKARLLIVEDDPYCMDEYKEFIPSVFPSLIVDYVYDVKDAVRHIEENQYSAAILDLMMEKNSDICTNPKWKAEIHVYHYLKGKHESVPIVLVTALDLDDIKESLRFPNAKDNIFCIGDKVGFLRKPCTLSVLKETVKPFFERSMV